MPLGIQIQKLQLSSRALAIGYFSTVTIATGTSLKYMMSSRSNQRLKRIGNQNRLNAYSKLHQAFGRRLDRINTKITKT